MIAIPHLLSILATLSWNGQVVGLNELQTQYEQQYGPGNYIPNVFIQYWSMRVMAYLATAIVLLALSIVVMPVLARAKRRVGEQLGGDPLILADAAETRICVLLSISTLVGLVVFTLTGAAWLDPVAGFVIAVFAINEGREAWEGELVEDDDGDDDDD